MRIVSRWSVAVLVTIAAFAVATWICGTLVLTLHDPAIRWGIAGAAGVAVAALAALWGHSYATAEHRQPAEAPGPVQTPAADSAMTRNTICGGTFHGPVLQGRDFSTANTASSQVSSTPPPATDDPPGHR